MKKMLLTVMIAASIVLGCSARVDVSVIKRAEYFCEDHGGVLFIDVFIQYAVKCVDGEYKRIPNIKLPSNK